jgi:hypothetical protein
MAEQSQVTTGALLGATSDAEIGASNQIPNSVQAVSVSMPCYMGYELQIGDKDSSRRWGGATRAEVGNFVAALQQDLKAFGTFDGTPDGDFGAKTQAALKRYQWVAKTLKKRLKGTERILVEITFNGTVSGNMDALTCEEMKIWKAAGYVATGNLVKLPVGSFSEFRRGTLSAIRSGISNNEMVFDEDFYVGLTALNDSAKSNGITVLVNQVLRLQGAVVSGAVVTPASKSQHLIGHAIDTNLVDGTSTMTSATFQAGNETESVKKMIAAAKLAGLRWGGDFGASNSSTFDPPHFDLQVPSTSDEYDYKFYFNQNQVARMHPIPLYE